MARGISRDNEDFIEQEIAEGTFRDRNDALDTAIGLLRQRKSLTARLANSRRQLDNGECVEVDSTGLRQLFDDLKSKVSEQSTGSHGE